MNTRASATTTPLRGVIEHFDEANGAMGTLRLDDGKRLVFFRYSCLGFKPAIGVTAFVWSTTPFEGGQRAIELTGSATKAKLDLGAAVRAADERAAAIIATLDGKASAAREAAQVREHVRRHLRDLRQPARPSRARFVGGPMPKVVTALAKQLPAIDAKEQFEACLALPFDSALVPHRSVGRWVLGFSLHPDLPVGLACSREEPAALVTVLEASQHDALIERLELSEHLEGEDDELDEDLKALFSTNTQPARSDAAQVTAWLDAAAEAFERTGRVLIDLYLERGWPQLAGRVEHHLEEHAFRQRRARATQEALDAAQGTFSAAAIDAVRRKPWELW
ncbi:MAG: hypothetical protein Q8S33_08890 [Myxococcales bacterium]|nr:hypothetical protein [Myxococcales bacterium]